MGEKEGGVGIVEAVFGGGPPQESRDLIEPVPRAVGFLVKGLEEDFRKLLVFLFE